MRPGSHTKVSVPLVLPQNRHPERSASQTYRFIEDLRRGVEGPRGCLIDAALQGLRPPRLQKINKVTGSERTRISCLAALSAATYAALRKESRKKSTEAKVLERKSGGGEGPAVRPGSRPKLWGFRSSHPNSSGTIAFLPTAIYFLERASGISSKLSLRNPLPLHLTKAEWKKDSHSRPGVRGNARLFVPCSAASMAATLARRIRSRSCAVTNRWQRRHRVRMLSRSHSPPPSVTGKMWSASHRLLRIRVFSPQWRIRAARAIPARSLQLAVFFNRVQAAMRANAPIALQDLLP